MTTQETDFDVRAAALAAHLEIDVDEITEGHDETMMEVGTQEYLVLDDDEADTAAHHQISDLLWAFNAAFLSGETGIDESVFSLLAEKCEDANDAVRSIVDGSCGIDSFVESAVSADGRGHFLSGYDGEERPAGEFYIYQTN